VECCVGKHICVCVCVSIYAGEILG